MFIYSSLHVSSSYVVCGHHQENQLYQYDMWCTSLQMSYWYNLFSWWWVYGCSKHV